MAATTILLACALAVPCDLDRFPGPEEAAFACAACDAWTHWLTLQHALRPWRTDAAEALLRARRTAEAWELLCGWHDGWQVADELRQVLGEEAWFLGRLPEPVPVWRVREVR